MRRPADRSSHAHIRPADGIGVITGDDSLFLRRLDLKALQDRRVAPLDTYVHRIWLVYGDKFHVPSVSYSGDSGHRGYSTQGTAMDKPADLISDKVEVVPVVVLSQT